MIIPKERLGHGSIRGCNMSDHRQVQKKHIRAAREWLGKAETSLDRHDDIQGDLKLMLARAELSHVAEAGLTKRGNMLIKKILPAIVAMLIAVAGFSFLQAFTSEPAVSDSVMPAESETLPVPQVPVDEPVTVAKKEAAVVTKEENTNITYAKVADKPAVKPAEPANEQVSSQPAMVSLPVNEQTVPAQEKQKLMQAAGKILRQ